MPKYNRRIEEGDNGELYEIWTNRNGDEEHGQIISQDDDYDDEIGEGCSACGNPAYPNCKTSCPMFDD